MAFPNRRRRNNRRPRPVHGRIANRPMRVSRQNDQQTTRRFRAISQMFFQQSSEPSSGNGTQSGFSVVSAVSDYVGSNFVSDNFEQYKVTNVEVLMKPSAATLNGGIAPLSTQEAIVYQNSVYSAFNSTYVQSFIDYDTDINPTFSECLTRPSLKVRALAPNNWTKVASFAPRTLTNPSGGAAPSNQFQAHWMSTENLDTKLYGLRGVASNPSPVFNTQDNVMCVDMRVTITVTMKGPKNAILSSVPLNALDFNAPAQGEEEEPSVKIM